ncbi:hypothetical protein [Pararhodobacter zhoushanensis]|uniref:hypothetical protein n=1 Tax=Pararhodobacter zhoushanensis TaxID=2479545 RepID=UPI0015F2B9B6|nr:hypothetical protein [Pararhodobacter zhoushanensis]
MNTRSTRSTLTFARPFRLRGYPDKLPAGDYEIIIETDASRPDSARYLSVPGTGFLNGVTELRQTTRRDLEAALCRAQEGRNGPDLSDAALSPQEDLI